VTATPVLFCSSKFQVLFTPVQLTVFSSFQSPTLFSLVLLYTVLHFPHDQEFFKKPNKMSEFFEDTPGGEQDHFTYYVGKDFDTDAVSKQKIGKHVPRSRPDDENLALIEGRKRKARPLPDSDEEDEMEDGEIVDRPPQRKQNRQDEFKKPQMIGKGQDASKAEMEALEDRKRKFMMAAKQIQLNSGNVPAFFKLGPFCHRFGVTSEILARIGYDDLHKNWRLYLKKENLRSNPSILPLLWSEMDEISNYLREKIREIQESIDRDDPLYKPEDETAPIEEPKEPSFWNHKTVYWTDSSHARIRVMWGPSSRYSFHINVRISANLLYFCFQD
jgi:hypothetical protein